MNFAAQIQNDFEGLSSFPKGGSNSKTIHMILRLLDSNMDKSVLIFSNNVSFLCIGLSFIMLAADSKVFAFLPILYGYKNIIYIVILSSVIWIVSTFAANQPLK